MSLASSLSPNLFVGEAAWKEQLRIEPSQGGSEEHCQSRELAEILLLENENAILTKFVNVEELVATDRIDVLMPILDASEDCQKCSSLESDIGWIQGQRERENNALMDTNLKYQASLSAAVATNKSQRQAWEKQQQQLLEKIERQLTEKMERQLTEKIEKIEKMERETLTREQQQQQLLEKIERQLTEKTGKMERQLTEKIGKMEQEAQAREQQQQQLLKREREQQQQLLKREREQQQLLKREREQQQQLLEKMERRLTEKMERETQTREQQREQMQQKFTVVEETMQRLRSDVDALVNIGHMRLKYGCGNY